MLTHFSAGVAVDRDRLLKVIQSWSKIGRLESLFTKNLRPFFMKEIIMDTTEHRSQGFKNDTEKKESNQPEVSRCKNPHPVKVYRHKLLIEHAKDNNKSGKDRIPKKFK
jgi:hypothetical protein